MRYVNTPPLNSHLLTLLHSRGIKSVSATGSSESHRVRLNLTLEVTKITFAPSVGARSNTNPSATPETTATLQIAGKVCEENPHVRLGAFHTLDLEVYRDVKIEKAEWDSVALERIEESCVEGRGAEVGAIVCGEGKASTIATRK